MEGWSDSDVEEVVTSPTPRTSNMASPDLFSERISQFSDFGENDGNSKTDTTADSATNKCDGKRN